MITDYASDAKELRVKQFETPKGQEPYIQRMLIVEPRFAYNKYTLDYR
ncbi:hypothetical protein [Methanosphaera sp. BMS]|nr:hypothetical protein [Methanosphaera sp. BMS]